MAPLNDPHLFLVFIVFLTLSGIGSEASLSSIDSDNVSSTSVLAALLESPDTEMMELVEKAGMLQSLESAVGRHNLTIFAPKDDILELHFDSDFKKFLLQPDNLKLLQSVVMFHVVPRRIGASEWSDSKIKTLSGEEIHLHWKNRARIAERAVVDLPDMIVRRDGVVHRIRGLLIPKSVEHAYVAARMIDPSPAVLPQGAPTPEDNRTPKSGTRLFHMDFPVRSASDDDIGSAPAPSPSSGMELIDGHSRVSDFISELTSYGGYNEVADLLVNLTSLASEIGKLVNEGHRLTVVVPDDHAIGLLTMEQLNAPGGIESMLTYHIVSEYQTEESLYSLAKRHDKLFFNTLHENPLVVQEVDGVVQFGSGKSAGLLLDPNIYTDGRISVQGINSVLIPSSDAVVGSLPSRHPRRLLQSSHRKLGGSFGRFF